MARAIADISSGPLTAWTSLRRSGERARPTKNLYRYTLATACRRGSKPSGASYTATTAMFSGRWAFRPAWTRSVGSVLSVSKAATCPMACTPASVLPAPLSRDHAPVSALLDLGP